MKRIAFLIALMAALIGSAYATDQVMHLRAGDFQSQGVNFAQLPTGPTQAGADTGSRYVWCADCGVAQTCAGGGTGAWAFWQTSSSSYACAGSLPTNLLTTLSTFGGDVSGTSGAISVTGWRGVPLKSGTPAANQTYVYVPGNSDFELTTISIPATGLQSGRVALSGTVTVLTSATTIVSQGLTMPSSGCPCRIQTTYAIYGTANAALTLSGYVTDGTNNWGTSAGSFANAASGSINGAETSTVTYANNASVTITLKGIASTSTFTAKQGAATTGATYLSFLVIGSS